MINPDKLNELEKEIDKLLEGENSETLTAWLDAKRANIKEVKMKLEIEVFTNEQRPKQDKDIVVFYEGEWELGDFSDIGDFIRTGVQIIEWCDVEFWFYPPERKLLIQTKQDK